MQEFEGYSSIRSTDLSSQNYEESKEESQASVKWQFKLSEVLTYWYEVINPPSNKVGRRAIGIQITHDQFEDAFLGKVLEAVKKLGREKKVRRTRDPSNANRKRSDNNDVKYFRLYKAFAHIPFKMFEIFPRIKDCKSSDSERFSKCFYKVFIHFALVLNKHGNKFNTEDVVTFF